MPALVLGWFAMRTGLGNLLNEDLWPTSFIKVGAKTESSWMPLALSSLLGLRRAWCDLPGPARRADRKRAAVQTTQRRCTHPRTLAAGGRESW